MNILVFIIRLYNVGPTYKDKHMDHREHQTGMDTGVKGDKGCTKLLSARGESRMGGR